MPSSIVPERGATSGPLSLQHIADSVQDLVVLLHADLSIAHANQSFARLADRSPEDLQGVALAAFLHPSESDGLRFRLHSRELQGDGLALGYLRLLTSDGGWRWYDAKASLRDCEQGEQRIILSLHDVTRLRRMEAERQVISDVVHALNQTSNLDQLLAQIHSALKKVVYAENFFVALYDSKTEMFHFPFFVDQFDPPPPPQKIDKTCMAYIFKTGKSCSIPQSEFDRLAAEGEVELVGSPSPSWLGVPLITPTETIGVLVVQHYQNAKAYDQMDVEFLDSVGGHIALAIERRGVEEALRKSESMSRLLFSQTPLPTWVFDVDTLKFLQVNDAAVRQYGYSHEEFKALTVMDIRPEEDHSQFEGMLRARTAGEGYQGQLRHKAKDGRTFTVDVVSHQMDYGGKRVRLVVAQDVSERKLLEDQLRQAQKMEAVGRLAGGVAHDFNNLLMVIKGHTELLLDVLPPSDHVTRKIEQIDRSADRATSLTRQLLAFSRMQMLQPRVINLNSVVEEMGKLIPRLIGEDVELIVKASQDLGAIRADASQMEQIIMNLAVNSRDAMPSGGKLMIETSNVELDNAYRAIRPMVQPGNYVLLAVSDTGTGMDAETQARIFEPFFTTKEKGKGTGLGLATVYGVVKQSGGFIWVYSELGKGTSFKIYLPRVDEPVDGPAAKQQFSELPRGTETILLAEDEQDVREVAREFLESAGYKVLLAQDGADALRMASEHAGSIDLLVTDMIMPGMSGQDLARLLRQKKADLGVIFMSGYSEHAAGETVSTDRSAVVLTKPFSRGAILRSVRDVLQSTKA